MSGMEVLEGHSRVHVAGRYDVVVAGGGIAGVSAALAARRGGDRSGRGHGAASEVPVSELRANLEASRVMTHF